MVLSVRSPIVFFYRFSFAYLVLILCTVLLRLIEKRETVCPDGAVNKFMLLLNISSCRCIFSSSHKQITDDLIEPCHL